ncbi:cytochrome b [Kiloniella laminariae]|uniref:cytochrome b n=1 Tax=Kiloniella laminariae TaxID=454162 RepID=UPI000478199C|nr:cytochrome b [Kiloniella laminariae]
MQYKNDAERYGAIAKLLHWSMALLIITLIILGIWMGELPLGLDKVWYYNLHKSLGLIVLALALTRLVWRFLSPPPPPLSGQPVLEKLAAHAVHLALYAAFILQPLIGIAHSGASGYPIVFFNHYSLPSIIEANKELADLLAASHFYIGWGIAALVLLHAGAALKHHFLDKDTVLLRMMPFGKPRS